MQSPIIEPVYKSILRRVTELIEELNSLGTFKEIEFHNFESRNDEQDLPKKTLVGVDGFSFTENKGLWVIRLAVAISSYQDINLLEEVELMSEIQRRMGEGAKIPLLEMQYGSEVNELVVTDFELLPMAQSELRNYRTIGLEIRRTANE